MRAAGPDVDRDRRQPPPDNVCPFLGFGDDPDMRPRYPTPGLLCHAGRRPWIADQSKQRHLCLNVGYTACAMYRQGVAAHREPRPWATPPPEAWGQPKPAVEAPARRPARARGTAQRPDIDTQRVLTAAALVLVVVVGVFVVGKLAGTLGSTTPPPSVAASHVVSPTVRPTPQATEPSVEPSVEPTPEPSPTVDPNGTVYVVKAGDSLYAIATRFHTTVEAIAAANGIADPRKLRVGQQLIIPAP